MSLPPVKTEPCIEVRIRDVPDSTARQERLELRVDVRGAGRLGQGPIGSS